MDGSISIDLDLHKAIENHRRSLDETQTDIVRRVLGANPSPATSAAEAHDVPHIPLPKSRLSRRGGNYRVRILGKEIQAHSLKEILKQCFLYAEERSPGLLEKLAQHRTVRGRRIVARKPEEIYPGKPLLVKNCAERLTQKWWYDTNISSGGCQRYLSALAQVGGFAEPKLQSE